MIIVTGGSGKLGSRVVEQLLERVPAEQIGVSVREPGRARALADRGVRVRAGDFADPASLAHAFEGARRVLIVSAAALGEDAVRLNTAAIAAAGEAGAERVFYTSHVGAAERSAFPPMPVHAACEAAGRAAGAPFTALRNGFYAATLPMLVGDALTTGELVAPEDGPVSWTTHADLAAATAAALAEDGLDAAELALTGAEAVDLDQVASLASELAGRDVRRVVVSDGDYRARLAERGLPDVAQTMTLGIFQASRDSAFARVEPTLAQLIGRAPAPVRAALEGS